VKSSKRQDTTVTTKGEDLTQWSHGSVRQGAPVLACTGIKRLPMSSTHFAPEYVSPFDNDK